MNFPALRSFRARAYAVWKFVLSFRKTSWSFEDYPVVVRRLRESRTKWEEGAHWKLPAYQAKIALWPITGTGDTRQEAVDSLQKGFDKLRSRRLSLPRPGLQLPVEFAPQSRFTPNTALTREFSQSVLGVEPHWLSEESSLWDFTLASSLDEYYERIRSHYGVDVSGVPNANIAAIIDCIAESRRIP